MAKTLPNKPGKPGGVPRPKSDPAPQQGQWVAGGGGQIYGGGPSNRPSGGGGRTVGSVAGNRVLNKPPEQTASGGVGTTFSAASADDSGGGGFFDAESARRNTNAIAILQGLLKDYGLDSLLNTVIGYVQDGYDPEAVMVLIRQTPQYAERFPAMAALAKKKRSISEAAYIEFERNASSLERLYGLPAGMLNKDTVTNLISNEVSAAELEDRVTRAASAAYQAAPEVRNMFKQYYGIESGGLTAYFLDPDKAMPLLEKQYVSAQLGAEAAQQGIGIDVGTAEMLGQRGITTQQAAQGFGNVAALSSLSSGPGEQVGQRELIQGNLLNDQEAQQAIGRVQKSRTGRFEAGGGFAASTGGVTGLGTSNA